MEHPTFHLNVWLGLTPLGIGNTYKSLSSTVYRCGGVPKSPRTKNSTYLRQLPRQAGQKKDLWGPEAEWKIMMIPQVGLLFEEAKENNWQILRVVPPCGTQDTHSTEPQRQWVTQDVRSPRSGIMPDTQLHSTADCWAQPVNHFINWGF